MASARWAGFGRAAATTGYVWRPRRQVSRRASALARKSWYWIGAKRVQMPPGLRKSGMPDSVLIPAPVKTTISSLSRILAANSSAFIMRQFIEQGYGADNRKTSDRLWQCLAGLAKSQVLRRR